MVIYPFHIVVSSLKPPLHSHCTTIVTLSPIMVGVGPIHCEE